MDPKKFLFIGAGALVLFLIIVLIAMNCGKSGKPTTTKPGSGTLVMWGLYDEKTAYDDIIKDFQTKNKTLKIEYVKKEPQEYLSEALNEIAAGNGPDIWAIPNTWLPKYHDKLTPMPDNLIAKKSQKKSDKEVYQGNYPGVVSQDNIIEDKCNN